MEERFAFFKTHQMLKSASRTRTVPARTPSDPLIPYCRYGIDTIYRRA